MSKRIVILHLLLTWSVASGVARAAEEVTVFDASRYADSAAADAAWRRVQEDTPSMQRVTVDGRAMLKLRCNFRTNTHWRVAWDVQGRWDLSKARELLLTIAPDKTRGTSILMYLHSGGGWYKARPYIAAGESVATVSRNDFDTEDRPSGWHQVDTVRICITRDAPVDRVVHLASLRATLGNPRIAVYRNDAGVAKQGGVPRYTRVVSDALRRIGAECEVMGDAAVAAGRLRDMKIVILPLNPVLPKGAADEINRFVNRGGKLIVCFNLPRPLDRLLGVRLGGYVDAKGTRMFDAIAFRDGNDRPAIKAVQHSWGAQKIIPGDETRVVGTWTDDTFVTGSGKLAEMTDVTRNRNGYFVGHVLTRDDHLGKERLLVEMMGQLWGGIRAELYERRRERLGQTAGMKNVRELTAAALANAADDRARRVKVVDALDRAKKLETDARNALAKRDAEAAHNLILRAQETYTRAFAVSVPARKGEIRAVWCHNPVGIKGRSWDDAMKTLADAGFNTIIPNMSWGYSAAYRSKVLPFAKNAGGVDRLAECLAAAKKHGIGVHVWRVNWNLAWRGSAEDRRRLEAAGRLQKDRTGKTITWLCPSNPLNQKLERDAMLEVARNYDVAGIHFDYIRYPGEQGCFCPGCRKRFETEYRLKVKRWPADVLDGPHREQWLQFRRDNITRVVKAVSEQARKIKPGVKISAAVFPNWTSTRDQNGQDWKRWVEKDYLDFVCPMQYTRHAYAFNDQLRTNTRIVGGRIPLVPGIGATIGLTPDGTLQQILIARKQGAAGFTLFDYSAALADEHLPLLKLGATAHPTRPNLK